MNELSGIMAFIAFVISLAALITFFSMAKNIKIIKDRLSQDLFRKLVNEAHIAELNGDKLGAFELYNRAAKHSKEAMPDEINPLKSWVGNKLKALKPK